MTAFWAAWLAVSALTFVAAETFALATNRVTLSRFVWDASKAWPPLPWVAGVLTGFIASHFWWGGALICY